MFKNRKALDLIFYPVLFFILSLFFLRCQNNSGDDYYDDYYDDRRRGGNYYDDYDRDRDGRRRSIRSREDIPLVTRGRVTRFSILRESSFSGRDCEDVSDRECREQCDEIFSRSSARSECEDFPEDMVQALYDTYRELEHIQQSSPSRSSRDRDSSSDLRRIDPSAVAVMVNIDKDLLVNLSKNQWGRAGTAVFLDWVARNPAAVEAMRYRDNEDSFKEVLLEFSNFYRRDSSYPLPLSLSLNVGRHRETFLYRAWEQDNHIAVQFVFDLMSCSLDSLKDCKQLALCYREPVSRSSRREGDSSCPYLSSRDLRRARHCYVQGPDVWSYIEGLLQDGDFRDTDIGSLTIDQQFCDDFCGSSNLCEL